MKIRTICSICGLKLGRFTCSSCGVLVCEDCFDASTGKCVRCSRRSV